MQFDEQDNKNTPTRTFHPLQFALIVISSVLLITLGISYLIKPRPALPLPAPQIQPPIISGPIITPWKQYRIKKDDTLANIFLRMNLSTPLYQEVMLLPEAKSFMKHLKSGQKIYFQITPDNQLKKIIYMIDNEHYVEIYQQNGKLFSKTSTIKLTEKFIVARGTILSSLSAAMRKAGLSRSQAINFVNIFNWNVSFSRQIRPGDQFAVVYAQYYSKNTKVKTSPILAAELITHSQHYRAFACKNKNNQINYYNQKGESLRKAFMRAPVHYKYISSPFSYRRWHPILHTIRAHEGVDLAAPEGTPVYAASDGTINFRGRRGGYGKVIILKHPHRITTVYAHLSQFSPKFHVSSFVQEGQIIGYVGSTGMATGSHLHYEFRINNIPYNPMTVKLPRANSIPKRSMAIYLEYTKKMNALLDQGTATRTSLNSNLNHSSTTSA